MSWLCIGHPSLATSGQVTYFGCHGADGQLWYDIYRNGGWQGARPLGGRVVDGTAVTATPTGATFFVEGIDQAVYETTVTNGVQGAWQKDGGIVRYGVAAA
jgi:hypothetical protein